MLEHGCSDEIRHKKYLKWLTLDLKDMAFLIPGMDECYHHELISMINQVLELVPAELIGELSDYYKLLYTIIQNDSFDDLVEFKKDSNSQELLSKYEMNNKNSKISVIIPVYNGAKYL